MHFKHFSVCFYIIHTYDVTLGVIFALLLAQNFKTEVLTVRMSGDRFHEMARQDPFELNLKPVATRF